jgi:hypothetical protein
MAAADGQMSDTDSIAIAALRLTGALDALEEAVERRSEADRDEKALANQVHALGSDRARLASELDEPPIATWRSGSIRPWQPFAAC